MAPWNMGVASGKSRDEEGFLATLMFSRIALTASACSGHTVPARCAWQQHLQHRDRGHSHTACAVSTVFAVFIQTRHYIWLCLFEDSKRWEVTAPTGKHFSDRENNQLQSKTQGNSSEKTVK